MAEKVSGIYAIICLATGKRYVGQSVDIKARWKHHRYGLNHPWMRDTNSHLLRAWKKYGPEQFSFVVLERVALDHLTEREQFHLDQVPSTLRFNFDAPVATPGLGYRFTDEQREKVRRGVTGIKRTAEQVEALRVRQTGVRASAETRAKMSAAHKGRKHSASHVRKRIASKMATDAKKRNVVP